MGQTYYGNGSGSELLDSTITLPERHFNSSGGEDLNEDYEHENTEDIQPPTDNRNDGTRNGKLLSVL